MPIDDVAVDAHDVFALSRSRQLLLEVDPVSLKTVHEWRLRANPHSVAVGGGDVYVDFASAHIMVERITLASGRTRFQQLATEGSSQDQSLAVGAGNVWVLSGGSLYRLNAATLKPGAVINPPVWDDVWFGDGSLWVASEQPNGGIYRLDPSTGKTTAGSKADAIQLTFSPDVVWASAAAGPTALDSRTLRKLAALPPAQVLSQGDAGIAVTDSRLWTTYGDVGKAQEIEISRPK